MAGDTLEYYIEDSKEKCSIEKHKKNIQQMVLDHLNYSSKEYLVRLLSEEEEKLYDKIYYSSSIHTPEYYFDKSILFAFVQHFDIHKEIFLENCKNLLLNIESEYYSINEKIRNLTYDDIHFLSTSDSDNDYEVDKKCIYLNITEKLERSINILSFYIKKEKVPNDTTYFILYYERLLKDCQEKIKSLNDSSQYL
jgi:hypothetical protein